MVSGQNTHRALWYLALALATGGAVGAAIAGSLIAFVLIGGFAVLLAAQLLSAGPPEARTRARH